MTGVQTCALPISLAMLVVYILLRRVTGLRKTRDTVQEDLALLRGAEETPKQAAVEAG